MTFYISTRNKFYLLCIISLLCSNIIFSMEIPFSSVPVQTDDNSFTNFVRIDPDDKKPETLMTKTWFWYDSENIYIRFEADIDSTFTPGEFAPRDYNTKGDYLRIQLITIPEAYYAYYYLAYPIGSLSDAIRNTDLSVDYKWNSSYSYTTENDKNHWYVTMRLPFQDMRFTSKPPYKWKVILTRYNKGPEEYFSLPYAVSKQKKDYFSKSMDITLTHKIKQNSDWKFRPYFVKSYDLVAKDETYDPEHIGVDISFNPSSKTKLKISLNPDFSDVPPDNAQNVYNSKYPPSYSENRFFFSDDLDAFGVDYSQFYTRFIVQPQIAVKFTGNNKTLNYGYLCAQDKKISSNGYLINDDDFFQLMSITKSLPDFQMTLASTSRLNTGYYNHVGIANWDWEFIKNIQIGTSHVLSLKHLDGTTLLNEVDKKGSEFDIHINANPGNWDIRTQYNNIQKDLQIDMGTIWDTGYENVSLSARWEADSKEKYLKSWGLSSSGKYQDRLDKNRSFSYASTNASLWFDFLPKYSLSFNLTRFREAFNDEEFDQAAIRGSFDWSKLQNFSFTISGETGKSLVYDISNTSNYSEASAYFIGNLAGKLNWSASITQYNYSFDRINYLYTAIDTTIVVLDNDFQIGSASLDYNFNNKMTWRNGLSASSNDAYGIYSHLTFYSNYKYEFKKDWFLYIGYKTNQGQDEYSCFNDFTGHFKRYAASAYLKLSITM